MTKQDASLWEYQQSINRNELRNSQPRLRYLYKKILKHIPSSGASIADMGFGDGFLLSLLLEKYSSLIGLDISSKNISITKKALPSVNFKLQSSGDFVLPKSSLDVLITSEVLEHMTDQELLNTIPQVHSALKEDGYWFITVPAKEDLALNACHCPNCGTNFHKWGHKQYWDKERIDILFKDQFTVLSITEKRFEGFRQDIFTRIFVILRSVVFFLRRKISRGTYIIVLKKK